MIGTEKNVAIDDRLAEKAAQIKAHREEMKEKRYGKVAHIHYRGGVLGEALTDDHTDDPFELTLGYGNVCRGLENELYDMEPGETRIVIIKPEDGYGEHDPKGVETYPRVMMPDGDKIKVGTVLGRKNPQNGIIMPVRCIAANDDYVTMDFNHPYAGKTLEYEVELIDVEN